jgi:hypothetical protein
MRFAGLVVLAACGVNQTPPGEPPPELLACVPDRDGTITAAELPITLGARVTYYVSRDVAIDLAGPIWDLSEERAADEVIALGPVALAERWYASEFPGAAFAIDAGEGLDGVFHQDELGLWLHGTASREPMPRTLVRYREPVTALRFPLAAGQAYAATADIPAGTISGLPFIGRDDYVIEVVEAGRLDLPYVRFSPTLRVRTAVVRTPSTGSPVVRRRSASFVFECFGEIARADSRLDEPDPDFTFAATLRRFALGVTP